MPRSITTLYLSCVFIAACAQYARAQGVDAEPSLVPDAPDYRATITPIVWWSAFGGDVSIAPGDTFDLEAIDADEPQLAAGAQARVDTERWVFTIGGFHRDDSGENESAQGAISPGTIAIPNGGTLDWDIDFTSVKATAGYRFEPLVVSKDGDVSLAFDVYGGVRFFDLDISVSSGAGSASFDEAWALPVVGMRMRLDLPLEFGVLVESDIGYLPLGDTTASSWEIFAGFSYHPIPNLGLRAGFRHMSINYLDDTDLGDEEFSGFLAGLYVGVEIRF